jgi:flavodoxin
MAKAMIIYDSKYGNTRLVAETIAEAMEEVPEVEATVRDIRAVDLTQVTDSDAILIGSPNHIGKATRRIRKFIDSLGQADLKGKLAAVFDTYVGGDFEKAMKKMEKQIAENAPDLKLVTPGLSIRVTGMKGPVAEEELPKCRELGSRVASEIADL